MNRFTMITLAAAFVLAFSFFLPVAKADQADWQTIVTFDEPVEIPGAVLVPGTYTFKIFTDRDDSLNHVLIYDSTGTLYKMVNAVPTYRVHVSDKPQFTLRENVKGAPEALRTWFWPSDHYGVEFLYNHPRAS